jgi:hypothetical protein
MDAKPNSGDSTSETPKDGVRSDEASLRAFAEAIAEAVVDRLDNRRPFLPELVDAPTLAGILQVDPTTVRAHARELGGCKIGTSLRFDPNMAIERARLKEEPLPAPRRPRRPPDDGDVPLLPIR